MSLDVRLFVPGLAINGEDPFGASLGGSETAGLQLGAALARADHIVTVFCNVERAAVWAGANLMPLAAYTDIQRGVPSDLSIVQRTPAVLNARQASKVNLLWVHDLLMARRKPELMTALHQIDRIVTVSDFQKRQYRQVEPDLPDRLFTVSRNGIDLDLIRASAAPEVPRDPDLIVCSARPERGVDVLIRAVFPALLERNPNARLAVAAYDLPNPAMDQFYAQVRQSAAQFGERIEWHGALSKAELYRLYRRASLYVYPTPSPVDPGFAETSCISAMEAMACGCVPIVSARGGLPETVGEAGVLIGFDEQHAAEPTVTGRFAAQAAALLSARDRWAELSRAGQSRAEGFGWDGVAQQFVELGLGIMREQCSDPVRLTRHFIRRQDIEGARVTLDVALGRNELEQGNPFQIDQAQAEELAELDQYLGDRFRHTKDPETLAAYYASRVGPNNGHVFEGLMQLAHPSRFEQAPFPRYALIDGAIRTQLGLAAYVPPEPDAAPLEPSLRILDFGCSQGECSVVLANRLGATVLGADAAHSEVERAKRLAQAKARHPERLDFVAISERDLSKIEADVARNGPFHVAVLAEVLEHLIDPVSLLGRVEQLVRPGGVIVLTMPYGPWETQQAEPDRGQHLREWGIADLKDVLRGKRDLVIDRSPLSACPITGEVLGNTVAAYKADHVPLHGVDWHRKLTRQRPRQSVSAALLLGGATCHETLHWCLAPVAQVADEIVIADAGMTNEARRIAAQYGAVIVPAPSPLQAGFEVSRNVGLARCRGDWVLMIDADERLLSPSTIWRYLRENVYHSYAIPQHHFAVDAQWKPDLPGRLFRRRPDEQGRTLRFVGMLHEHPEFGPNQGAGRATLLPDVKIAHVGYIEQANRANRYVRNLPMLKRDLDQYPDRKLGLLVLMRDSMIQAKWLCAMGGAPIDQPGVAMKVAQVANLCRDVVSIWDKHFADDHSPMAAESLEHYHEACRMLGTDVVGTGQIMAQRQGIGSAPPQPPTPQFYFSVDHLKRAVATRLKAVTEPLEQQGF